MEVRPRVGVSSCLLGEEVRFNGGHKRYRFLTDELGPYVDWVPYCPEVSIGLGTPREPIRLTADGRLVNRSGTADHTEAMAALPLPAGGLDGYVFKAKSPSCGIRAIPRYGQDGLAAHNMFPQGHFDFGVGRQVHIGAGPKLDQADAIPAGDFLALLHIGHNAPGDDPSD